MTDHPARITWSPERIAAGLFAGTRLVTPAWFAEAPASDEEGWSLVCTFEFAPSGQGSPSAATVQFLADDAPHDQLRAGTRLLRS